jgi:hypothetical protein
VRAPDYAGALIGWRVWCVVERGGELLLGSVIADELWPRESALVATCRAHQIPSNSLLPDRSAEHEAPAAGCTCGIYAAREPSTVWTYLRGRDEAGTVARVLGRVLLWGRLVEHEHGWRAQFAYPLEVCTGDRDLRRRLTARMRTMQPT